MPAPEVEPASASADQARADGAKENEPICQYVKFCITAWPAGVAILEAALELLDFYALGEILGEGRPQTRRRL